MVKLRALAHARAGDKGNILNIAVIAYERRDYLLLEDRLTRSVVQDYFSKVLFGKEKPPPDYRVVRYTLPHLRAMNFVLYGALGGGVTRSLRIDPHGKCLSAAALEIELEAE